MSFSAIAGEARREGGRDGMEAAPSAKPRRAAPPIPPNYVSLRQLQELRLKEKEEQEKRQLEEEEAAAAAAAAAARREAALKVETKGSAASPLASGGAKERGHFGQGQGHQWVAVAQRPAAPAPTRGGSAARKSEGAVGGGRGMKGRDEAAASSSHGRGKPEGKAKGKEEEKVEFYAVASAETRRADEPGKPVEAVGGPSRDGMPEDNSERKAKAKGPGAKNAESGSSDGPGEAAGASSRGRAGPERNRKWKKGVGDRSAGPSTVSAPAKTAGASPPRSVESKDTGSPKHPEPRLADPTLSSGSSDVKKASPPPAPRTKKASPGPAPRSGDSSGVKKVSAAEGKNKPTAGGELRNTAEAKPEGFVEGQRRQPVAEVQAAAERKLQVAGGFRSAARRPSGGRGNGAVGAGVWVPKAASATAADPSGCAGV